MNTELYLYISAWVLSCLIIQCYENHVQRTIEIKKLRELEMLRQTISVWGRAILDLKVSSVKMAKNHEQKENAPKTGIC